MKTVIVALVLLFLLVFPSTVFAQLPEPDILEISEVQIFRHLLEANDTLYILRYNIEWANDTQPLETVDQTFEFLLKDDANSTVGNETAYPFHNYGYNQGLVAFYFPGNTTNPEWGELGNITVQGTALFDAPVPSGNYTIVADDYSAYTSPGDIREELRQFLISQFIFLEYSWNGYWVGIGADAQQMELLYYLQDQRTNVLSTTGEAYITGVIGNITLMCPQLFLVTLSALEYEGKDHSRDSESEWVAQWDDTPVEELRVAVSGWMGGVGATTAFSLLMIVFLMFNMTFTGIKWGTIYPGIMVSLAPILVMTRMGLPDIALVFIGGMTVIAVSFYLLLLRPSQG